MNLTLLAHALLLVPVAGAVARAQHAEHHAMSGIPRSLQEEHEELQATLKTATQRQDEVGSAARELARVLNPHFHREEQIALPPLGALRALASGSVVENADRLRAMADSLERELPGMLREHKAIAAAVERLRLAATSAGAEDLVRFAHTLRLHALAEEEIHYPAALLVGKVLRQAGRR